MQRVGLALAVVLVACSDANFDERADWIHEEVVVCAGSQTTPGVDVSHWEGTIDWPTAKSSGVVWAIVKATQGNYLTDSQLANNWPNMKGAGVIRGAYHFMDWQIDPVKQADYFVAKLNQVGGLSPGDLPPVLDVEETPAAGGGYQTPDIGKVLPFLQRVECLTGRKPVVYTRASFIDPLAPPSAIASYPLWVAHYTSGCPNTPKLWSSWRFWQYSDKGSVSGIPGAVDMNHFDGSLSELVAFANGSTGSCGSGGAGGAGGSGGGTGGSGGGTGGSGGGTGGSGGGTAGTGGSTGTACDLWITQTGAVIQEDGPCAIRTGAAYEDADGDAGHAYWTSADVPSPDYYDGIVYDLHFAEAGSYRLRAFIPAGAADAIAHTQYKVQFSGQAIKVDVDQAASAGTWVDLGTYDFAAGSDQWVRLGDYFIDAADEGKRVMFDALEVAPALAPAAGGTSGSGGSWGSAGSSGTGWSGSGGTSASGSGAGDPADPKLPGDGPGCACRSGPADRAPGGLLALLAGALGIALRRRHSVSG